MLFPQDWEHSRARRSCWLKTICVTEIIVKEMFKTPCKYSSISLAWHENVAWVWHHAQASNHKLELRIYMLTDRFYSAVQDLIQQFHTLRFMMKGSRVRFFPVVERSIFIQKLYERVVLFQVFFTSCSFSPLLQDISEGNTVLLASLQIRDSYTNLDIEIFSSDMLLKIPYSQFYFECLLESIYCTLSIPAAPLFVLSCIMGRRCPQWVKQCYRYAVLYQWTAFENLVDNLV